MISGPQIKTFLPTSSKEVKALGWEYLDVILFSGDAYIDHPSFGVAVIGRVLEKMGLKVAIVPQPNWRDDLRDFKKLGRPRLFFGVSAGNMDSMINHYTAHKRLRSDDAFTPGGQAGTRPDYAVTVYSNILKQLYPEVPIVIGGIEASLRRLTHYDYWSESLKPSVLVDSKADLLVYGLGEKAIVEIAHLLSSGRKISEITQVPQTAFLSDKLDEKIDIKSIVLHSFEKCKSDKKAYAENFRIFEEESNKMKAAILVEAIGNKYVIVNPPYDNLSQEDIDEAYSLPYTRLPHPRYKDKGSIPAYEMIKNSINIHRGCFGGCSFCTISAHQGKFVLSRSEKSIMHEIEQLANTPGFNGTITDLGGPSANMFRMKGKDLAVCAKCKKASCIFPRVCPNLDNDHGSLTQLYKSVSAMKNIKYLYIGSGVRYDLVYGNDSRLRTSSVEYLKQLIGHHVSGRLKVAPEHTSDKVLSVMRKPSFLTFKRFLEDFKKISQQAGKNQQLIPYFISSHPASTLNDMADLVKETRNLNFRLEQVQDFTPTPMTLSSCMYYTGINPYNGEKVFVAQDLKDKKAQMQYFFSYKPEVRKNLKRR